MKKKSTCTLLEKRKLSVCDSDKMTRTIYLRTLTISSDNSRPLSIIPPMPFTLHPATVDDASDITAVFQAAFAKDHIMSYFHPNVPAPAIWEKDFKLFKGLIAQGDIYGERFAKVIDEENG